MRIKSYFAPSVQSAISIARKEFGDDVTLVTSHTAALESRHLGDYEVVFAVDEVNQALPLEVAAAQAEVKKGSTQVIKAAAAAAGSPYTTTAVLEPSASSSLEFFGDFMQQAMQTPLSTEENVPEKLARIETLLLEIGLDGLMVRSLMTMIERVAGASSPVGMTVPVDAIAVGEPVVTEVVAAAEPAGPALPDLTPAELEFYLSVSVGA